MTDNKFPPLPAMSVIDRHLPTGVVIRGYTADQMRAYAAAAVAKERKKWCFALTSMRERLLLENPHAVTSEADILLATPAPPK